VRGHSEATTPLWLLSPGLLTLCELRSAKDTSHLHRTASLLASQRPRGQRTPNQVPDYSYVRTRCERGPLALRCCGPCAPLGRIAAPEKRVTSRASHGKLCGLMKAIISVCAMGLVLGLTMAGADEPKKDSKEEPKKEESKHIASL